MKGLTIALEKSLLYIQSNSDRLLAWQTKVGGLSMCPALLWQMDSKLKFFPTRPECIGPQMQSAARLILPILSKKASHKHHL